MERVVYAVLCTALLCSVGECANLGAQFSPEWLRAFTKPQSIMSPDPKPFAENGSLPGSALSHRPDKPGEWWFRHIDDGIRLESGHVPRLFFSQSFWFYPNGSYDLVYQAWWGARASNDPRFNAVDTREHGKYTISDGKLRLEPESTQHIQVSGGKRTVEMIANESRTYLISQSGRSLHIAGRCAKFQVEPICRESPKVWYTLKDINSRNLRYERKPSDLPTP